LGLKGYVDVGGGGEDRNALLMITNVLKQDFSAIHRHKTPSMKLLWLSRHY